MGLPIGPCGPIGQNMPNKQSRGRDLAKDVVNDLAESYRVAITQDSELDPYVKANARLGLAIGQLLANVAVDVIADWADEE
jgi:tetrahydromethanopterin S-methyltransferase subunit F